MTCIQKCVTNSLGMALQNHFVVLRRRAAAAASNNKTSIGTPTAQEHDSAKRLLCLPKLLASGRLESSGISSSGETPCLLWRRRASWSWIFERLERWVALRCLVSHHLHHPHSRLVEQPAYVPQAHPKSITHQFSEYPDQSLDWKLNPCDQASIFWEVEVNLVLFYHI